MDRRERDGAVQPLLLERAAAAKGATSITLSNLPTTLTEILVGDRITYAMPAAATMRVPVVNGTATVTVEPLPQAVPAAASVFVERYLDHPCRGWREEASLQLMDGAFAQVSEASYNVLTKDLPVQMKTSSTQLIDGAKTWLIASVGVESSGAVWRLGVNT